MIEEFFLLRLPGADTILYSAGLVEAPGLGKASTALTTESADHYFVIKPFERGSQRIYLPYGGETDRLGSSVIAAIDSISAANTRRCQLVADSLAMLSHPENAPELVYPQIVGEAVDYIKELESASGEPSKIVLSGLFLKDITETPSESFQRLCRQYPRANVFLYSTPQTGPWIGASPELLVEAHAGLIRSVALAGSKRIDDSTAWDAKNREEHAIVARTIAAEFDAWGLSPLVSATTERSAGPVKHLYCEIEGNNSRNILGNNPDKSNIGPSILDIADSLSPTPALGGYPRREALDFIRRKERHRRGCYAGYAGIVGDSYARLFVNLRSALLAGGSQALVFAGAGITSRSEPEKELAEILLKSTSIYT